MAEVTVEVKPPIWLQKGKWFADIHRGESIRIYGDRFITIGVAPLDRVWAEGLSFCETQTDFITLLDRLHDYGIEGKAIRICESLAGLREDTRSNVRDDPAMLAAFKSSLAALLADREEIFRSFDRFFEVGDRARGNYSFGSGIITAIRHDRVGIKGGRRVQNFDLTQFIEANTQDV